ncbi:hypothetical protein C5D09_14780 [Rathayibacter sp. AY1C9]|nr:hypothetical protein C5D09_14780 [Rathayibacter sp. AY1C9]
MDSSEHYLVTTRRPWDEAPTVVGIFTTSDDADAAVACAQQDGLTPDRYSIEVWRGNQRACALRRP